MKNFRLATFDDLAIILEIIKDGQEQLKSQGIDQWQEHAPSSQQFIDDIEKKYLYVLSEDDAVIGVCALVKEDDPNYTEIDGQWLTAGQYSNIHRFAVKKEFAGQGVGRELMRHCLQENTFPAIRIDTHKDNKAMKKLISHFGFEYCGVIKLSTGELRNAYESINTNK